jgi:hypothetical protein
MADALSVRFLRAFLSISRLQRTSALRPSRRNVHGAAFFSWAPSRRLLRSASMTVLRNITAETFCAMPISLTVNGILQYFVTALFAA